MRDLKLALTYLVSLALGFDSVPADVNLEHGIRNQMTPLSTAVAGAFFGILLFLVSAGYRIVDGRWPHER